jgi:hypothetical protein
MRSVLTTVAVLAGVLALSACGSSHRTAFTNFSRVGALSVPTPAGFHSSRWSDGVVISNRSGQIPIPCTTNDGCPTGIAAGYPTEDELVVYKTAFHETPPVLTLPLTLRGLRQVSDGLTVWGGAGSIAGAGVYSVDVWLGPRAPAADRAAILSALETIKSR